MRLLYVLVLFLAFSVPVAAAPRDYTRYLVEDVANRRWCVYDDWKTAHDDAERFAATDPDSGIHRAGTLKYRRGDLDAVTVFNNAESGDWLFEDVYRPGDGGFVSLTRTLRMLDGNLAETTRFSMGRRGLVREGVSRAPLTRGSRIGTVDGLPEEPIIYGGLATLPFMPLLSAAALKPGERDCRQTSQEIDLRRRPAAKSPPSK